jgi:MoaA/NifB/PqqE/SkfB family radical SAM enzyme
MASDPQGAAVAAPMRLSVVQLEPSTHCTLRCPTCPRTAFAAHWENAHFPFERLEPLVPALARSELVVLQGWGEPLCNPELPRMVARLTEAGARCTITTNGCLLDERMARELLRAGLPLLTVSISGAKPETHARLRPPSDLSALLERIARTRALAREMGAPVRLTVSFLQQPENIEELPEVVALAKRLGLDDCLAVNATFLPTKVHERHLLRPGASERSAARRALWGAIWRRQAYTRVECKEGEKAVCANDPTRNLTIGASGAVSPCIFLQLPLKSEPPERPPEMILGNVFETDLEDIWNGPDYAAFRETFARRHDFAEATWGGVGRDEAGRRRLREAPARLAAFFADNPAPAPCRACAKLQGL